MPVLNTHSFQTSDYYATYDTNSDGTIDNDELNEGVFNSWDANRDGRLDREEYDQYRSFYTDPSRY